MASVFFGPSSVPRDQRVGDVDHEQTEEEVDEEGEHYQCDQGGVRQYAWDREDVVDHGDAHESQEDDEYAHDCPLDINPNRFYIDHSH